MQPPPPEHAGSVNLTGSDQEVSLVSDVVDTLPHSVNRTGDDLVERKSY